MTHPFMEQVASAFAAAVIATLRYQFPYMEKAGKRPILRRSLMPRCGPRWRKPARCLSGAGPCCRGQSFGGRMTSQAQASRRWLASADLRSWDFHCIPRASHPTRGPGTFRCPCPHALSRATRDKLAELQLLTRREAPRDIRVAASDAGSRSIPLTSRRARGGMTATPCAKSWIRCRLDQRDRGVSAAPAVSPPEQLHASFHGYPGAEGLVSSGARERPAQNRHGLAKAENQKRGNAMKRREFLKTAGAGLPRQPRSQHPPSRVYAQLKWRCTTSWPKRSTFPSARRRRFSNMSRKPRQQIPDSTFRRRRNRSCLCRPSMR